MRKLIALFGILSVFLFAQSTDSERINEKLLLGYSTQAKVTQEAHLALKLYFQEKSHLAALQKENDLQFKMVRLGTYHVTVIYPIHSLKLRNDLLLNLSPLFSDIIAIDREDTPSLADTTSLQNVPAKAVQKKVKKTEVKKKKNPSTRNFDLSLKWLFLALLASVGLVLSIRRRKKLRTIKEGQEHMQNKQKNIETQINTLGEKHA